MCISVCMCLWGWGRMGDGQKLTLSIFSVTFCLILWVSISHWSAEIQLDRVDNEKQRLSCLQSWHYRQTLLGLDFYMYAEDPNSGPHTCTEVHLSLSPLPAPPIRFFSAEEADSGHWGICNPLVSEGLHYLKVLVYLMFLLCLWSYWKSL